MTMSGQTESNSMDSVVSSLSNSLKQVPLSAIPPMVDCILASTGLSPSTLFTSLLNSFPSLIKDVAAEEQKWDSGHCNCVMSMVGAICHLMKKLGTNHDGIQSFIWKCFIPLIKIIHVYERDILNQIGESFFDAVNMSNSWNVLETTLVPFFLNSVGLSMGMLQNEEQDVFEWGKGSVYLGVDDPKNDFNSDKESKMSLCGSFPLTISCQVLTLILDAAFQSLQSASGTDRMLARQCCNAADLFGKLLWDLCRMSVRLLSQSLEHRSCAIGFLLPIIFKAFGSYHLLGISFCGRTYILSGNLFFKKIWECCRLLFSIGPLERRDAYRILSLDLTFLAHKEGHENANVSFTVEEFDIGAEREFWDEIKRGLVDEDGLLRKQSLHILKTIIQMSDGSKCFAGNLERKSQEKHSVRHGMTKRELWADKEAKSLGVGKVLNPVDSPLNSQQQWEAFFLLYEMLEEYGTHLVEAAWNHQVTLLLKFSLSNENFVSSICGGDYQSQIDASSEIFSWLTILWQRGFHHDNPQVRCLIMESFLGIDWVGYGDFAKSVPESFVLGSLIEGLNDPVHHQDFGVKGMYTSRTIDGAACFFNQYTVHLNTREGISFLHKLASVAKRVSFGRAGLMSLAHCIASSACGVVKKDDNKAGWSEDVFPDEFQIESQDEKTDLLNVLRFVIESSKQHFNPNYRLRVCEKILEAVGSVVSTSDVSLEIILHFISTLPREFTDYGGPLRVRLQGWLLSCDEKHSGANCSSTKISLLKRLQEFPERFTSTENLVDASVTFDDQDLNAWESGAKRWARTLFLVIKGEHQLRPIMTFIQNCSATICKQCDDLEWSPVKFLVLAMSLVLENQTMKDKAAECGTRKRSQSEISLLEIVDELGYAEEASMINEKFTDLFLFILEELVSFANISCSLLWSSNVKETTLPNSVRGKLGGPSQRRLSSSTSTTVLQAITSMQAVAAISSWCGWFKDDISLASASKFLWKFFWEAVSFPTCESETGAEVHFAAYEALAPALKALVPTFSAIVSDLNRENDNLSPLERRPCLDLLILPFLENINKLLAVGLLARTRRAVLLKWKWLCLESLLSIPYHGLRDGLHFEDGSSFFSDAIIRYIFSDLVESLENAGEDSVLPMLRSIRLILQLLDTGKLGSLVSSCSGVDTQMMWHLVRSSWILHVSCKKRRVASIAALLSSVLHTSAFADERMHLTNNAPGPLKWFVQNVLEEGTKSPRTIRLAALHLTGLWLSYPKTIKYYIKEMKLLTLYGSVAFDEDFEAELADNHEARTEVSLLAKSPDSELTEAFINTELYARVSVAVLFHKLADLVNLVGSANESEDCLVALESGKLFLLELLDSTVNDKDLAKELYKKYSAIHRRKIRAWQMICVLSPFVKDDIVGQVTRDLHICLSRNNLPAVRQYLETFAINIYLKFPLLVGEQLVPILRDYDRRPQALSSYVFIAANIILHASKAVQSRHLDELLPSIVPLLTSHHHSLRAFTQLLVHQVFCKYFPLLNCGDSQTIFLERRCFEDLKSYLEKNPDCKRLRASMGGYLDAYNPTISSTPAGIFVNRVEDLEFECVPTSLMEEVLCFLNDVREDLRCAMAKDVVTIKNESLKIDECLNNRETLSNAQLSTEISVDFQRKITLAKYEKQDSNGSFLSGSNETSKQLLVKSYQATSVDSFNVTGNQNLMPMINEEMEKEDVLLDQSFQSRNLIMERIKASRQDFILVASLLDRIPNLAGLARTCEVFKACGLVIADANILQDKQFQLISVTAEKWVPIMEVPVNSVKNFLEKKKRAGFSILGLEQTANSVPLDKYVFPRKTVLVLGREKEGIPADLIHILDVCIEIPQLGVVRSLNVHVSGAIALWEYTRQQRSQ